MARTPGPAAEPSTGPGRHEARERAISLLYEADLRGFGAEALLETLPLDPDPYAIAALRGIDAARAALDALIERHSDGWSVTRMPMVDRAILRLSTWELVDRSDVPTAVVIDEAIELAKDYSTERSPAFINGVLDAVAREARP